MVITVFCMLNESCSVLSYGFCLLLGQKDQAARVLKCMEMAGASFDKGEFRSVIVMRLIMYSYC